MLSLSRSADNIFARWWWTIDRWNLLQILSLAFLGVIFVTFVIIPWVGMVVIGFIKSWWDENNRFDG